MEDPRVLTINAGSSSIKLDVFGLSGAKTHSLTLSGIGQTASTLHSKQAGKDEIVHTVDAPNHVEATKILVDWLQQSDQIRHITAIGHRIVHGGPDRSGPEEVTEELIDYLASISDLDPEHTPAALHLIQYLHEALPNVPHIACFDTAYFHNLPPVAQLLPLPKKYQKEGLRRYGFHGLSYTYLDGAFRKLAGDDAANGKVIYAHLGSGASLAAVSGGTPIDTTMGFTPSSGIIMSTRSGDIDPGLAWYMQKKHGVTSEQFSKIMSFESGLLGVSGLSADMYTLLQHQSDNPDAAAAVQLFVYQVKKTIGAFAAALGGLNSLVFSGGIGEQSALLRSQICDNLDFLGIHIDPARNEQHAALISSDTSGVGVHVLPTDEAQIIYNQVVDVVHTSSNRRHL